MMFNYPCLRASRITTVCDYVLRTNWTEAMLCQFSFVVARLAVACDSDRVSLKGETICHGLLLLLLLLPVGCCHVFFWGSYRRGGRDPLLARAPGGQQRQRRVV